MERFATPPPHPDTVQSCTLDLIADHLSKAHALIEGDGGKEALPDLRNALFRIGRELANRTQERIRTLNWRPLLRALGLRRRDGTGHRSLPPV